LVFNPGERVLGTTAPGYALLLGVLARFTGMGAPAWGTLLALLSLGAVALVLRAVLGGARPAVRLGVPLLFGAAAYLFRWNVEMLGAESFPLLALGVGSAWLAVGKGGKGRETAAGLLVAAAMMIRLDAALLAGILGLTLWWRGRRFPWRFAVAGLVPVLLFLAWLQASFGAVIPNTMAAKQSELAPGAPSYLEEQWRWLGRSLPLPGRLVLLAAALWGGIGAAVRRREVPGGFALVLLLWIAAHEVAYRVLAVPFAPWYHVQTLNVLLAGAALGAVLATSWLWERLRAPGGPALPVILAGCLLLPVLLASAGWVRGQFGRAPDPRWDGYMEAARRIREAGGTSVAAVEIGFLGYESGARVLDLMGLVSPEALAARREGTLPALVARERPDYLVDVSLFQPVLGPILAHPDVAGAYREVAELPDGRGPGVRLSLLRRSIR
jgi:hypothetical protein